jgi:hypothetical protein
LRRADAEGQFSQWSTHFLLLGLEAVKAVEGFLHDECGLPDLPGDVTLPDIEFGQVDGAVEATGFIELANRSGQGGAVFLFAELLFLAKPDQQDAVGFDTGYIVEQQAAAGLAFHVTASEDVAEKLLGCLVDNFRRAPTAFLARRCRPRRRRCAAFPGFRFLC